MKVTRITIDADLGLIELTTGPGGDGNYVLLPIDVPPTAERYLRFPGEPTIEAGQDEELLTNEERPYSGMRESAAEARGDNEELPVSEEGNELYRGAMNAMKRLREEGAIIAAGGWSVPKDQAERELNSYLAADSALCDEGLPIPECDGNCGAHVKPGRDGGFWDTDAPVKERHTGPATCPDPVHVFAINYGHGYRLTCPALPQWTRTINHYDLHRVPGLIAAAMGEKKTVSVTIIEEQ